VVGRPRVLIVTLAVVLVAAVGVGAWWHLSSNRTGDPGGRVMAQLVPVISAVPEQASKSYVWRLEPHQDSCDGIPSTRGWSQVVVQIGFKWRQSPAALFSAMNSHLVPLGWSHKRTQVAVPLEYLWTKRLTNGTEARLTVDQEYPSSIWQLDAIAPPVGRAASGC
jgi:hypothetical protein